MCHRTYVMRDSNIIESGLTKDIFVIQKTAIRKICWNPHLLTTEYPFKNISINIFQHL